MPKMVHFGEFLKKTEACGQTVLPDRSILIGQKLMESAKIQKLKCDISSNNVYTIGGRSNHFLLQLELYPKDVVF